MHSCDVFIILKIQYFAAGNLKGLTNDTGTSGDVGTLQHVIYKIQDLQKDAQVAFVE